MPTAAAAYCRDLLRRHDPDRYLASLFAPDAVRPQLWGLYAFSCEIARIRELVSEPAPGEVRLAWWTEDIEAMFAGEAIDHPVAQTLAYAGAAEQLPKQAFIDLIEARRFDLYRDPMPSLGDLEGYLGETASAVVQLAVMILDRGQRAGKLPPPPGSPALPMGSSASSGRCRCIAPGASVLFPGTFWLATGWSRATYWRAGRIAA